MTTAKINDLVRRITRAESQLTSMLSASQLVHSAIENGSIGVYEDGSLRARVGLQHDGTWGAAPLDGPTPPTPGAPSASGGPASLTVFWDGMFSTLDDRAPLDLHGIEVYVSETPFSSTDAEGVHLVGFIPDEAGGSVSVTWAPGEWHVGLVAKSVPGKRSEVSQLATVEVETIVDPAFAEELADRLELAQAQLEQVTEDLASSAGELNSKLGTLRDEMDTLNEETLPDLRGALTSTEDRLSNAETTLGAIPDQIDAVLEVATEGLVAADRIIGSEAGFRQAVIEDLAVRTGAIMELDAGQLTVTGSTVLNEAVAQTIAAQTGRFLEIEVGQLVGGSAALREGVIEQLWTEVVRSRQITSDMIVVGGTGLLDNPGFLPDETGTWGPGWELAPEYGGNAEFVQPDDLLDANAIRITSTSGAAVVWNTRTIAVTPGEEIHLSAWGQGNSVGLIMGVYRDRDGNLLSTSPFVYLTPSTDWQKTEGSWTVPTNAATLQIAVGVSGVEQTKTIARVSAHTKVGPALIVHGAITADHITASEEMWTKVLGAHKVQAVEIDVEDLVANSAFIGEIESAIVRSTMFEGQTFTGGTFTGTTFRTAASGRRVEMDGANGFRAWNASNTLVASLGVNGLDLSGTVTVQQGSLISYLGAFPYEYETSTGSWVSTTLPGVRFTNSSGADQGYITARSGAFSMRGPGDRAAPRAEFTTSRAQVTGPGSGVTGAYIRATASTLTARGPATTSSTSGGALTLEDQLARLEAGSTGGKLWLEATQAELMSPNYDYYIAAQDSAIEMRGFGGSNSQSLPTVRISGDETYIQGGRSSSTAAEGSLRLAPNEVFLEGPRGGIGSPRGSLQLTQAGDVNLVTSNGPIRLDAGGEVLRLDPSGTTQLITGNTGRVAFASQNAVIDNNMSHSAGHEMRLLPVNGGEVRFSSLRTRTTTASANVATASTTGVLARNTSSRKHKIDPQPITLDKAEAALGIDAQHWIDKPAAEALAAWVGGDENVDIEGMRRHDHRVPGFIAEDFHDAGLTEFVEYSDDGEVESLAYDRIPALHHVLLQHQRDEIETLKNTLAAVEARLAALEGAN